VSHTHTAAGVIVFAHGNSFVSGTYNRMFKSLRSRGYHVHALERLGHDANYPVTNNWPHLVEQLAHFAAQASVSEGQGVFLVGHSLGGILSLMCAARHPQLGGHAVRGVVMLDSPLVSGWRAPTIGLIKRTPMISRFSPARASHKRRQTWPSREAVLESFQKKRAFAQWDPQALQDYVTHGFRDVHDEHGQHVELAFSRDVETAIYNTLPHNVNSLLRRHPLQAPLSFVRGSDSFEMKQLGEGPLRRLVAKHPGGLWQSIEGSHLYPMEKPLETAECVHRALRSMAGVSDHGTKGQA
jgi:pimeloyl-ACP methyl ester carboxylesterase